MWKYLIPILLAFILSCKGKTGQGSEGIADNADDRGLAEIKIDLENSKIFFDLSDRIDTSFFDVIPLETNENCLMGSTIKRFFLKNEKIYILESQSKAVYIFGMDGSFVSKIQSVGGGPMDYVEITDMFVNDEHIVLMDNYSRKVMFYDLGGNFQRYFRMDGWFANSIYCFEGRIYYMNDWSVPPAGAYRLFSSDMEGGHLEKYMPFEQQELRANALMPKQSYYVSKDKVFMMFLSSDTVYSFSKKGVRAQYALDFMGKSLPEHYYKTDMRELMKKGIVRKYVLGIEKMIGFGDMLSFQFSYGDKVPNFYTAMYGRKTKLVEVSNNFSLDYFGMKVFPLQFSSDGYLISVSPSDIFKLTYERNPPAGPSAYNRRIEKVLNSIDSEDNPVVLVFKMKMDK